MARRRQVEGTLAEVEAIIAEEDGDAGYPKRGTHVGKGPHVQMPATWDGTGPTPAGYTKTWAIPEEHPTITGRYSVPMRDRAHKMRIRGRRFAGRLLAEGDFRERSDDWQRSGD